MSLPEVRSRLPVPEGGQLSGLIRSYFVKLRQEPPDQLRVGPELPVRLVARSTGGSRRAIVRRPALPAAPLAALLVRVHDFRPRTVQRVEVGVVQLLVQDQRVDRATGRACHHGPERGFVIVFGRLRVEPGRNRILRGRQFVAVLPDAAPAQQVTLQHIPLGGVTGRPRVRELLRLLGVDGRQRVQDRFDVFAIRAVDRRGV